MKKYGPFYGIFVPTFLIAIGGVFYLILPSLSTSMGVFRMSLVATLCFIPIGITCYSLSRIIKNREAIGPGGLYDLTKYSVGNRFAGAIGFILFLVQTISIAPLAGALWLLTIAFLTNTVVSVIVLGIFGGALGVSYYISTRKPRNNVVPVKSDTTADPLPAKALVKKYLDSFFNCDAAPGAIRRLLHMDFTFHGPVMTAGSPEDFITQIRTMGSIRIMANIHYILDDGLQAAARYDMIMGEKTIPSVEWYKVQDGKIVAIHRYCDPVLFPKKINKDE